MDWQVRTVVNAMQQCELMLMSFELRKNLAINPQESRQKVDCETRIVMLPCSMLESSI